MQAAVEPSGPADLADLAEPIAVLMAQGRTREAEVVVAFLALWILDRVESGRMSRDEANLVFTTIDARLTFSGESPLSDEFHQLVLEGEHFHHWGEEWGADPARVRELANAILQRAS